MQYLWWSSRYGKFWIYKFIFLFKYKDDTTKYEKLFDFSEKLIKLYLLYSVTYQKSVNKIKGQFNNQLLDLLVNDNYQKVIAHVEEKLYNESDWEKSRFKEIINGDILSNGKVKNILCRLSALLEENYNSNNPDEIGVVINNLFHTVIDIEHIQSYNDENLNERDSIKNTWGENLNSLGNLVILEREINRSISNTKSKKLDNYKTSNFNIVNSKLVEQYEKWDLNKCLSRKEYEITKIYDFVLGENITGYNNIHSK